MEHVQDIFSPDGSLKASFSRRADGTCQGEFFQRQMTETGNGPETSMIKLPGQTVLTDLGEALAFAARHVGLDRDDFDEDEL